MESITFDFYKLKDKKKPQQNARAFFKHYIIY